MQLNCWHRTGGSKDVVRFRRVPAKELTRLRAALRAAREGEATESLYELPRAFSSVGRAGARMALGVGVVAVILGGCAAFLAPSAADTWILLVVAPGGLAALLAGGLGYELDTGLEVFADGRVRRVGWSGITERNVRDYARVTVAERAHTDPVGWSEP